VTATTSGPPRTASAAPILVGFLLCVFAIGTAENLIAGLLPRLAGDLGVSTAVAGQTVTAYALGVVVGAPVVTALTARLPRKGVALAMVGLFLAGTAISAAAPDYAVLVAGRVVAALAQGTLYAIALVVAAGVVAPERAGRAIAAVVSGLTVATVLGVPLGSLIGDRYGWRVPFVAVGVVAAGGGVLLAVALPRWPAPDTGVRQELRVLARRPVLAAVAMTAVGFAGVGTVYTYIAPLLTRVTGFPTGMVSALLLAFGAGSVVGNLVAGRLTDISPTGTLRGVFAGLVALLAAMPFAATGRAAAVAAVLVLGLLSTATITPLQRLILDHAGAAPTLAVAVNVGGFNLANALGAALGGVIVAAGALRWSGLVAAGLAAVGLALATASRSARGAARST
jgi:MFS transporter, DHA1 family, inner membrane transport protein